MLQQSKIRLWSSGYTSKNVVKQNVPFPQSTETRKESKQILALIDVYCKCRAPLFESDTDKDPGLHIIECTVCKEWFNNKFERVPNIYFRDHKKVWKCSFCK